jgi:hypothetical protein
MGNAGEFVALAAEADEVVVAVVVVVVGAAVSVSFFDIGNVTPVQESFGCRQQAKARRRLVTSQSHTWMHTIAVKVVWVDKTKASDSGKPFVQ